MMGTELVPETSCILNHLTRLEARKRSIENLLFLRRKGQNTTPQTTHNADYTQATALLPLNTVTLQLRWVRHAVPNLTSDTHASFVLYFY